MKKVSIIIPAYNEEKRISATLGEYGKFFKELKKKKLIDFEILVVINRTTDNTEAVVKKLQKEFKEIRCLNFEQGGKGFAIIEGFKDSLTRNNDLIGFVDADNATSPEAFSEIVRKSKHYGGVIASRYVKGSTVYPKQSIKRIVGSRIFNILIRSMLQLPYRDTQCGAKIFKRNAIALAIPKLKMSKWAFDVDLLYCVHKRGFKIKEISTRWSDREDSKIDFLKNGIMMALAIIRLRILNSLLKKTIKFYDKIISKFIWKIFK